VKIAKFKDTEYGYESVCVEEVERCDGYIRISEYVDVEFPPLKHKEVVLKEVEALEKQKTKVQAEAHNKTTEIDRRIGELLALPSEV